MLIDAKIDPDRDLRIVELPGAKARDVSFGVFAARAWRRTDRWFWANAMGGKLRSAGSRKNPRRRSARR
jgi:hypothetical protein